MSNAVNGHAPAMMGLLKTMLANKAPGQDLVLSDSDVLALIMLLDWIEQQIPSEQAGG